MSPISTHFSFAALVLFPFFFEFYFPLLNFLERLWEVEESLEPRAQGIWLSVRQGFLQGAQAYISGWNSLVTRCLVGWGAYVRLYCYLLFQIRADAFFLLLINPSLLIPILFNEFFNRKISGCCVCAMLLILWLYSHVVGQYIVRELMPSFYCRASSAETIEFRN